MISDVEPFFNGLSIVNDKIFLKALPPDEEDDDSDGGRQGIFTYYRMNLDGSDRQRIILPFDSE
jgi:hypothetical protein